MNNSDRHYMCIKEIMHIVPHQNAAFYLAHELGHQLGLEHQIDGPCYTDYYMSVMTRTHTVSYEQARWSQCENRQINQNICKFTCLFDKPVDYQRMVRTFDTLPGQIFKSDQQAKMIEIDGSNMGEIRSFSFMPSTAKSRCLYFRYYIDEHNNGQLFINECHVK
jgi:hypothetical protein